MSVLHAAPLAAVSHIGSRGETLTPRQHGEPLVALVKREPRFMHVPAARRDDATARHSTRQNALMDRDAKRLRCELNDDRGEHAVCQ